MSRQNEQDKVLHQTEIVAVVEECMARSPAPVSESVEVVPIDPSLYGPGVTTVDPSVAPALEITGTHVRVVGVLRVNHDTGGAVTSGSEFLLTLPEPMRYEPRWGYAWPMVMVVQGNDYVPGTLYPSSDGDVNFFAGVYFQPIMGFSTFAPFEASDIYLYPLDWRIIP